MPDVELRVLAVDYYGNNRVNYPNGQWAKIDLEVFQIYSGVGTGIENAGASLYALPNASSSRGKLFHTDVLRLVVQETPEELLMRAIKARLKILDFENFFPIFQGETSSATSAY